jgi:hypothetical protein
MMSEDRSTLAAHDAKVKKLRTTKAAAQALADSEIPADIPDDVAEQAAGLMAERQALKDTREIRDCQRPLKALIIALNRMSHRSRGIQCRADGQQSLMENTDEKKLRLLVMQLQISRNTSLSKVSVE